MNTVVENNLNIDSWQLSTTGAKLYSADAVIDAYLKGKKEGLEQTQKAAIQQLESNIRKAATHTLKVFEYLKEQGITPITAYLKLDRFDVMEVMFTLEDEDLLNDKITSVYDYVCSFEEAVSEELYNITFGFVDQGPEFNESLLRSDGYVFKRDMKSPEASA